MSKERIPVENLQSFNIDEALRWLQSQGHNISRYVLTTAMKGGEIQYRKVGKRTYIITRANLMKWIGGEGTESATPPKEEHSPDMGGVERNQYKVRLVSRV
ncbi:MAG: hypothetical protein IKN76_03800 [Oscillospiraceae bacterium]|nr:hypothetical protein [Oscillospiraceae bacterium]